MIGLKDKFPHMPDGISGLRDLAYNMWWSWNPEARALFKLLSRQGWYLSNHNPVRMINMMDAAAMERELQMIPISCGITMQSWHTTRAI